MARWGRMLTALGLLLLVIGVLPALFYAQFLPGASPVIPALLSLSVAPLGALIFVPGVILLLVSLLRR